MQTKITTSKPKRKSTSSLKNKTKIQNIIDNLEPPYNNTNIVSNAEIVGNMRTANNSTDTAIANRLNKGQADWYCVRRSFVTNKHLNIKLKKSNSLTLSSQNHPHL